MTWASSRLKLWKQHRTEQRQKATERIAHTLYQRRVLLNRAGDQSSDWAMAEKIVRSPLRRTLFSTNGTLIKTEKRIVEPLNQHLKNSALFDIIDRLSPALEATGVLLIPLVLYLATQAYEQQRETQANERLQQESVQNYIAQLSEILLNVEGDLRSPENQRIRAIATAATFTLLNDPLLNGRRKGQVIGFLSQMELVQGPENTDKNLERGGIISLSRTNLSFARLVGIYLSDADMSDANLMAADLSHTNLMGAGLSGANLNDADMSDADLFRANLNDANLSSADLSDAEVYGAQNWSDEQLGQAKLCATILPKGSKLDPNRDCLW